MAATFTEIFGTNAQYDTQTGIVTFKVQDHGLTLANVNDNTDAEKVLAGIVKTNAGRTTTTANNMEVKLSTGTAIVDRGGVSKFRIIHQIYTYLTASNIPTDITPNDV